MTNRPHKKKVLTYASAGVDRSLRDSSRRNITARLVSRSRTYQFGHPIELPFGLIYPSPVEKAMLYDLQIEGVGTKTLLAEMSGDYRSVGIDAVAMTVNDVIRSGANPFLLSDAIHISKSRPQVTRQLVEGVMNGAKKAGCVLASGETGDVPEILHQPLQADSFPFDIMVSAVGFVRKHDIIRGSVSPGDVVIGLESSGIHSNGLTLARKILLRKWGGRYAAWDEPDPLNRPLIEELLEPTKIYAKAITDSQRHVKFKAAVHITGDGLGKFRRLVDWMQRIERRAIGFKFEGMGEIPSIFRLIYETARSNKNFLSSKEMFETFNMGFGFAVVVDKRDADATLDRLNKHCHAVRIGEATREAAISVDDSYFENRRLILDK
ncbi:MAG: phosphoribosylformylglycinamidine cyclo-ligase [Thaumarchaeota archaeon]|nr:phosphoribosylformylglycinamidine cyclo-ligase [Nitrososphaerota archaeon]